MSEETTTEQLAEIEGQAADTPATEYTPPEGWRVLAVGEQLQPGDQVVQLHDGKRFPTERVGQYVCETQRYIRPIEPQPEPQPVQVREGRWRTRSGEEKNIRSCEPLKGAYYVWPWTDGFMTFQDNGLHQGSEQSPNDLVEYLGPIEQQPQTQPQPEPEPEPQPVQVREGRWRTRGGVEVSVSAMPTDHHDLTEAYPWWDGNVTTWANDGRFSVHENAMDLVDYLGPIEEQPEPVPAVQDGLVRDVTHLLQESGVLDSAKAEEQIEELRSEVSYVQRLLGESRQRVTQLEELVGSLRTINEAQEKAFNAAGKANTDLQHRLNVVAAEWAEQAEASRRLQIELDAAQQVPQAIADRFEEGWNQGTARAVETVLEWLQPIRAVDNEHLANETLQHLPQIMRHLTGLAQD